MQNSAIAEEETKNKRVPRWGWRRFSSPLSSTKEAELSFRRRHTSSVFESCHDIMCTARDFSLARDKASLELPLRFDSQLNVFSMSALFAQL
jgi:hypothetical protein